MTELLEQQIATTSLPKVPEALGHISVEVDMQQRNEHSRSLEDGELFKAVEDLRQLGLLIPLRDLETYHGRADHEASAKVWRVDPDFRNGKFDSAHSNINSRSTLYAGSLPVAIEFAEARVRARNRYASEESSGIKAHTYEIASSNMDAMVANRLFSYKDINRAGIGTYLAAMRTLLPRITDGAPVDFADRTAIRPVATELMAILKKRYEAEKLAVRISEDDITRVVEKTGGTRDMVRHLAAAVNAKEKLKAGLIDATRFYARHDGLIAIEEETKAPISNEYIARTLQRAHIVGLYEPVNSATLNKVINVVSLFDMEKVNTIEAYSQKQAELQHHFARLEKVARQSLMDTVTENNPVVRALRNPHEKPAQLVAAAKQIPGYAQIFDADAGNWEGYTLAEHTESVLTNFEENFADKLPVGLQGVIKLGLLIHDIGKPQSVIDGEKHRQSIYNAQFAEKFMDTVGIDAKTARFVQSLIGDGMELAHQIYVKQRVQFQEPLQTLAKDAIEAYTGQDARTEDVTAYLTLCHTMLTCDGGAYTTMAVTRTPEGFAYRNAGAFDASFSRHTGPTHRKLRLEPK